MSRTDASRVNPAIYVPTTFFELAKIAASGRLGPLGAGSASEHGSAPPVAYPSHKAFQRPLKPPSLLGVKPSAYGRLIKPAGALFARSERALKARAAPRMMDYL